MTYPTIENKENESLSINLNLLQQKGSPISPSANTFSFNKNTSPSYSLFNSTSDSIASTNMSWDWFSGSSPNTPLYNRKHSINADGNDFSNISSSSSSSSSSYGSTFMTNNTNNYWRRASEPNNKIHSSQTCTSCLNKHSQLFTPSCGQHQFCNVCSTSQSLNLLMQGACPRCTQTVTSDYNMHLATKPNNATTDYMLQQNQQTTSSYSATPVVMSRNFSSAMTHYPCVKLSNIPWDVSQNDIRHFFGNCRSPSLSVCTQSIHIMMDRTTGKTLSDAYVEFANVSDMRRAIESRNQKPLKGRVVSVNECSQEELLSVIFPKWRGQFRGTLAIPPVSEVVKTMSTAAGGGNSGCPPFITREEINSLLVVCKNYKLHFSRKCAERPFENIISVIAKYPWGQLHLISTMHRDHVYEMLKLSIESLKTHLAKDYVQIDSTLLERLTRAGIMCPAFTERQKTTLLQTARIECPADIESFLNPSANANIIPHVFPYQTSIAPSCVELQQQHANLKPQSFSYLQRDTTQHQQSPEYFSCKNYTPEYNDDSGNEDDDLSDLLLSPNDSPISSLIRDIQQNCYIDDNTNSQKSRKTFSKSEQLVNSGTPLLLQTISNGSQQLSENYLQEKQSNFTKPIRQLSPWATSYAPKSSSVDIWRMPTTVEAHHRTSNSLLAA